MAINKSARVYSDGLYSLVEQGLASDSSIESLVSGFREIKPLVVTQVVARQWEMSLG